MSRHGTPKRVRGAWLTWLAVGALLAATGLVIACESTEVSNTAPPAAPKSSGPARPIEPPPPATADASTDAPAPKPAQRFLELRGVVHVHSPYSHDACDGMGLSAGVPNASCLADLRAAPCTTGYDFVALTDHASHLTEYEPEANVLYDAPAGDELVKDANGATVANRMTCSDGHKVLITYGHEGQHTLPIMFKKHPQRFDAYQNTRPIAEVQSLVADLHDAGALVGVAHMEELDIDARTVVQGGADVMEWYNPHANLLAALGGDNVTGQTIDVLPFFKKLDGFLAGSTSGAHADLFYLLVLPSWPQKPFDRWREVQKSRFVPGFLGSDVHQNVHVEPLCKGASQVLCALVLGNSSRSLAQLVSGGHLTMADGRRFDAYERLMRWLHNRVYAKSLSPDDLREAIAHGRSYGLFSVFGNPTDFFFDGEAAGKPVDLGDEVTGPVSLRVQLPSAPSPIQSGASFDSVEANKAEIRGSLFRTDANGTKVVAAGSGLGNRITLTADAPGSYHLEVWIKPRHLAQQLGDQSASADGEYLWLITNPIRVK